MNPAGGNAGKNDFFCIELLPEGLAHSASLVFGLAIAKKSGVSKESLVVTTPEFRHFLNSHEVGIRIRQRLESGERSVAMGSIGIEVHYPHSVRFMSYYPFEEGFENLLKGKGISSTLDARIFRYLKEYRVDSGIARLSYGKVPLAERREQVVKRGGNLATLEQEYSALKRYLKLKRREANSRSPLPFNAKSNKKKRLARH